MRFYSCDNKDFRLLGYDAMQVMNGGRHLVKDRDKNSLILGSKEFESAVVSEVAYPYKFTM